MDYFTWQEDEQAWRGGIGVQQAATYGELLHLWTNSKLFVTYEARLLRFIANGGEVRRVFLLGPDLADQPSLWLMLRTLLRHDALGFKPRVKTMLDFREESRALGINCDTLAILNGRIGYFFKFPGSAPPVMVRTTDRLTVVKAANCVNHLWREAESGAAWCKRQPVELPSELRRQLDVDIAAVQSVAELHRTKQPTGVP